MTVVSSVKSCLASLKGAQANLSTFAQNATDEEAKRIFHECMLEMDDVIMDIQKRVGALEHEEPQYKGF
ncbi:DUF1657 domain-containing protein [Ectobacillus panaciterrae]|uniref:DUF1657 domain-containing protein n=1 Tax=Ectobacillus panaciterrae TaxID=363872 RepID=UPI0003F5EBFE|nr:DUF1657 domain-containing protein [Ectobacillus panaciterrae]